MITLSLYHPAGYPVEALLRMLRQSGYTCAAYVCVEQFLYTLCHDKPEAAICCCPHEQPGSAPLWSEVRCRFPTLPCYVVTNHHSGWERILALQEGVGQYYIEPYSYTQLIHDIGLQCYSQITPPVVYQAGSFSINLDSRQIRWNEILLSLSQRQYALLGFFLRHPQQIVSRTAIWEAVWGVTEAMSSNTVDAAVYRLRKRLPAVAATAIQPAYGIGYICWP